MMTQTEKVEKKRIAIFCVCYNSYELLNPFFDAVENSAKAAEAEAKVSLYIADNTENNVLEINYESSHMEMRSFPFHKNLGYFGAVHKMMCETDCSMFDYIIISNVDVFLKETTLRDLCAYAAKDNIGWIAPYIYSEKEKKDRNPQSIHRYSKRRLSMLRVMFKYPVLHSIYLSCLYKHRHSGNSSYGNIYAGHGSFIILTRAYIQKNGIIDYPVFLYGEEIYLAENCYRNNLKVVHTPDIQVYDLDHYTTSKMKHKTYCQRHLEAIEYILQQYFS